MPRPHLLLVDPDLPSLRITDVSLRQAGFDVTALADGAEALAHAQARPPDLVLAEVALPSLDGFQLLTALRGDPATAPIPFVFLTTDATVDKRVRAVELGADDFLSKPVFIKEIVARVRILVARRPHAGEAGDVLEGSLAELGLVDLLRATVPEGRAGEVTCRTTDGDEGRFWFRDGRVCDAQVGRLTGAAAFHRLLTWKDGQYRVRFKAHAAAETITTPAQALLLEGLSRLDQWTAMLGPLGGLDAVYVVDFVGLARRLGDLPDEANAVLRLVDGQRPLRRLLDDAPFDDLATLGTVVQLVNERVVRALDPAPAVTEPPVDSAPSLEAAFSAGLTQVAATREDAPSVSSDAAAPTPTATPVPRAPESTPVESTPVESTSEPPIDPTRFVGRDGKPLRGAALARAIAAEARRRSEPPSVRRDDATPPPSTPTAPPPEEAAPTPPVETTSVAPPPVEAASSPTPIAEATTAASEEPTTEATTASSQEPTTAPSTETAAQVASEPSSPEPVDTTPSGDDAAGFFGATFDDALPTGIPLSDDAAASDWAVSASEEITPPSGTDLAELLGSDGPRAPTSTGAAEPIEVVRYPSRRGVRRQRLEAEAARARALAREQRIEPATLAQEVLRPGVRPTSELVTRIESAAHTGSVSDASSSMPADAEPLPASEEKTDPSILVPQETSDTSPPPDAPSETPAPAADATTDTPIDPGMPVASEVPTTESAPTDADTPPSTVGDATAELPSPSGAADPSLAVTEPAPPRPRSDASAEAVTEIPFPAASEPHDPEPADESRADAITEPAPPRTADEPTAEVTATVPDEPTSETTAAVADEAPSPAPDTVTDTMPPRLADDDDDEDLRALLKSSQRSNTPVIVGIGIAAAAMVVAILTFTADDTPTTAAPEPAAVVATNEPKPGSQAAPTDTPELEEPSDDAPGANAEPPKEAARPEPVKPETSVAVANAEPKPEPRIAPATTTTTAQVEPASTGNESDAAFAEAMRTARSAMRAENYTRAITALRRALAVKADPIAQRELGKAHYMKDEPERAREALQTAVQLDANDPEAWMYLGIVQQDLGRRNEACRAYDRYLQLAKDEQGRREIRAVKTNLGC